MFHYGIVKNKSMLYRAAGQSIAYKAQAYF